MPTYVIYYRKSPHGPSYRIEQQAKTTKDARYNFRQKHLHWTIIDAYEKGKGARG